MYVALNISNSSIQILSLKGRQVKRWGDLALDSGQVRDGLILQPQAVGEAIDALFKTTRIPREKVTTSLAGLSFTYRFLSLPRLKPALIEEAILRAAKKEISLPLEELYLSWQPLPGREEEQDFFILGVPRNLVDAILQALDIAGIEPYQMDLRPLALARAASRRDAIVVNLQSDCFDIVFIAGGIPRVIHTISPRSEGATLEDNIRRLADELAKTVAFYQSGHPESQLSPTTPLLLTGELAAEVPTHGLLQAEVAYPVETLVPPVACPPELPVDAYTASIGLALKKTSPKTSAKGEETGFHDININILSGKFRTSRARPLPIGYIVIGAFLAIAVVLLYPLYQGRSQLRTENAGLQAELNSNNRQLNLASLMAEETARKEDAIQEIIVSTETLQAADRFVLGNRGDYIRNLQMVTGLLPPGTYFISIGIDNDTITIGGETDSVFTVIDYATALEAQEAFSEVRITALDEDISPLPGDDGGGAMPGNVSVIIFEIRVNK